MPLPGGHMSISGGLKNALYKGAKCGCQALQDGLVRDDLLTLNLGVLRRLMEE